jgi:cyclophilin family peptidyl-prolyl cis-trans isomerase
VVELETSLGTMAIELEPDKMPITTDNFLAYVDDGFYAGTIFHRVVPNFVIQGGGFESGMLQKSTSAPIPLETHPDLTHVYGAVSMARTTNPDSATSQFFIVNAASGAPHLDGEYAAFGKLVEGSSVLDAISLVRTTIYDVPLEDVFVLAARRRWAPAACPCRCPNGTRRRSTRSAVIRTCRPRIGAARREPHEPHRKGYPRSNLTVYTQRGLRPQPKA